MIPKREVIARLRNDFRKVWKNLKHGKVAKWTLLIHLVYYGHATAMSHGWDHMVLSGACAFAIAVDLFHELRA